MATKKIKPLPTLDSLYELISANKKVTPSIEKAILIHPDSDFRRIDPRYCGAVCKLCSKDHFQVDRSLLREEADVLIIQDHRSVPGKHEAKNSFYNKDESTHAGIVDFLAEMAGFKRGKITFAMTSLLKCRPTEIDFPGGKPPTETTMKKCFPYLVAELDRVKPKVIITLGTASTKALGLKKVSNSGNRGEIHFVNGIPVVVTLHPRILSYIRQNARGAGGFWGPDYLKVIARDFAKARMLATGELVYTESSLREAVEQVKPKIFVTRTLEQVEEQVHLIRSLPIGTVISFDTGTTGVDVLAEGFRLLTIQFGWKDPDSQDWRAVVIPLWHRENSGYNPGAAWERLSPILTDPSVTKVGHNAKFDVLAIYWATGVRVVGVKYDTLLMIHSMESGTQGCYGLKAALWDHLPEMKLGGYEDLLGDLSKLTVNEEEVDESV